MAAFENRRVYVHCAANMRVSAFVFLYRVLCQRVAISEAEKDLQAIWQPDEVWRHFIRTQLARAETDRDERPTDSESSQKVASLPRGPID
jgi:hypothetical protein